MKSRSEELAILYREDETMLVQERARMQMLQKATVIPGEERAKIGKKLKMSDQFIETLVKRALWLLSVKQG